MSAAQASAALRPEARRPFAGLVAAVVGPVRRSPRLVAALGALVVLAESTGLVARRSCAGSCSGWARLLDMDALGSVPRTLITLLLAGVAVVCARAVRDAGRHGAAVWWAVLCAGALFLAAAKHWSLHSLVEVRLGALVPDADVQLLFVLVAGAGLAAAAVSGRWIRRDTRAAVVGWLALYAGASVGLAAVSVAVAPLGSAVGDLSTWFEETGEGLSAVGLLAAVLAGRVVVGRRQPGTDAPDRSRSIALGDERRRVDDLRCTE